MGIKEYQKRAYENKVTHGFNVTNVEKEFLFLYGEVAEAFEAYKQSGAIGEELADVAIYLFGLAEMLEIDLDQEIQLKMAVNEKRVYEKNIQGYVTKIE